MASHWTCRASHSMGRCGLRWCVPGIAGVSHDTLYLDLVHLGLVSMALEPCIAWSSHWRAPAELRDSDLSTVSR